MSCLHQQFLVITLTPLEWFGRVLSLWKKGIGACFLLWEHISGIRFYFFWKFDWSKSLIVLHRDHEKTKNSVKMIPIGQCTQCNQSTTFLSFLVEDKWLNTVTVTRPLVPNVFLWSIFQNKLSFFYCGSLQPAVAWTRIGLRDFETRGIIKSTDVEILILRQKE